MVETVMKIVRDSGILLFGDGTCNIGCYELFNISLFGG